MGGAPGELRHLCGRIGELYAALITNGQMAAKTNQKGYDVVSKEGERISVKTTGMLGSSGHVSFNSNTLELVDRIIILRVNTEEMQIETLLDAPVQEAKSLMSRYGDASHLVISLSKLTKAHKPRHAIATSNEVQYKDVVVRELESGTIEVEKEGLVMSPVKPELRKLALELNVSLINANGGPHNTRQLGTLVIKAIRRLQETETPGYSLKPAKGV